MVGLRRGLSDQGYGTRLIVFFLLISLTGRAGMTIGE